VGEQVERRTQAQQAALGTLVTLDGVPLRATNGTEQDGIRGLCLVERRRRQRIPFCIVSSTTDQRLVSGDIQRKLLPYCVEHLDGFCNNFRADAITRQNQDMLAHYKATSAITSSGAAASTTTAL